MLSILKIPRTFHSHACSQSDPSNMRYLWQLMEDFLYTTGNAFFHPSLYKTKYSLSTSLQCQFFQFQPYLANLSCGYGMMSHTRKQNHIVVAQIDNKCRATIFYKSQEPLVRGHIFTIRRINTLVLQPNVHSIDPERHGSLT